MVDILHRIGTETPTPDAVYEALTTVDGLAGWRTDDVQGSGEVGGVLEFRFPPVGGFDMEVLESRPSERVVWRVADGPEEWLGTTIEWNLRQDVGQGRAGAAGRADQQLALTPGDPSL